MDTNTFGIPTGPVTERPDQWRHENGDPKDAQSMEAILRDTLLRRGVEPGEYDERMIRWFCDLADWGTFATIASWVERAR